MHVLAMLALDWVVQNKMETALVWTFTVGIFRLLVSCKTQTL